ncbi:MAG: hypothetical protein IPP91_10145 [Betaproteobacteria bacterium]|nr:hypothetical protein [Betaproteobacteria bacterium]
MKRLVDFAFAAACGLALPGADFAASLDRELARWQGVVDAGGTMQSD